MINSEYIESLEKRIEELENKLEKSEKISKALSSRVEKFLLMSDSDYSFFESNAMLNEYIDKQNSIISEISEKLSYKMLELEKADKELHSTVDKLNEILFSLDDIVWSMSYPDYKILFINNAAASIYGCPVEEFYKNSKIWMDFIHDDDKEFVFKTMTNLHEKRVSEIVYRIVRADGQIRYILDKSHTVIDSNGKITRIDGLARDITALKEAELSIAKSQKQYELIFESSTSGIVILDSEGNIVALNKNACSMFGYKKVEVLGRNGDLFLTKELMMSIRNFLNEITVRNDLVVESKERKKNSQDIYVEMHGTRFRYEGEKLFLASFIDISLRKENEFELELQKAAIVESEYKLNALLNNSDQSFILINSDYSIIAFNKRFSDDIKEVLQYDVKEGENILDVLPDISRSEFKSYFERALQGETVKIDKEIKLPFGFSEYYAFSYSPVVDSDGRINSVVLNTMLITNIIKNEKELKLQNFFISTLLEAVPIPVFYKDIEGKYIGCNVAFEEIMNINRHDIIGKSVFDVAPIDLAVKYHEMDKQLFDKPGKQTYEWEVKSKNGSIRQVIFHKATFFDADGFPAGLIGAIMDITDRKSIEKKLIASQSELRAIYDSTPILMCLLDEDLKIKNANLAFMQKTGWPNSSDINLVGNFLGCINAISNADGCGSGENCSRCHLRNAISDVIKTGKNNSNIEFKTITKRNGEVREEFYLTSIAKIASPDSISIIISMLEITERKQLESQQQKLFEQIKISKDLIEVNLNQKNALIEQLEISQSNLKELNAEKDKFFSILAHDLKNPFNLIKNYSDKLITDIANMPEETVVELLVDIKQSTDSVHKLLENLLDWSRIKIGKFDYDPIELDLYELSFNAVYTFGNVAKSKDITLTNEIQPETYITADYYMISTVIRNLVSNALKFTDHSGSVVIYSKTYNIGERQFIRVTVADSGVGMSPEQLNDIFKIDKNNSSLGTHNEKGTGLGLILCKEFIEKHNGLIWAESKPFVGSQFHFALPI